MLKVSVIIPVFNGERFICDAIESVLGQTYKDFELIVVDDGSQDQTPQRVKQYGDRLTYLYQPKSGPAKARNLGHTHSDGEYLAFLDSDDRWYPNKLEIQVDLLDRNPQVSLIYSDVDVIDEEGNVLKRDYLTNRWSKKKKRHRHSVLGNHLFPYPSTVLLRKSVFEKVGRFDSSFYHTEKSSYHTEDFPLWVKMYKFSEFIQAPHSLSQRRIHREQVSRSSGRAKETIHMMNNLWNLFEDEPDKQAYFLRTYARTWSREGQRLIRQGNIDQGRKYLILAFKYYPFYFRNFIRLFRSYMVTGRTKNSEEKTHA